jgi:hypothetical protein
LKISLYHYANAHDKQVVEHPRDIAVKINSKEKQPDAQAIRNDFEQFTIINFKYNSVNRLKLKIVCARYHKSSHYIHPKGNHLGDDEAIKQFEYFPV